MFLSLNDSWNIQRSHCIPKYLYFNYKYCGGEISLIWLDIFLQLDIFLCYKLAKIYDAQYLTGYLGELSGSDAVQNQSGGLYKAALAVTVSSCHKSPVGCKQGTMGMVQTENKSDGDRYAAYVNVRSYTWTLYLYALPVLRV